MQIVSDSGMLLCRSIMHPSSDANEWLSAQGLTGHLTGTLQYIWRVSEASETLSGVTNGNRRYKYILYKLY